MMKKYITISFLLLSAFMAGCQEDPDEPVDTATDETVEEEADNVEQPVERPEDETINQVMDNAEDLESYEAAVDLEGSVDGTPYNLNAEVAYKDGNPPDLLLKSNNEIRTVAKDGSTYIFTGDEWVETTESMNVESLFFVTYESTINSFAELSEHLTKEETDDAYLFTYEGTNQSVYQVFETLLRFEFGTVDTSDVFSELTVSVDKDRHLIEYVDYEASGEDAEGEYSLSGDVEFMNYDNVDTIELPTEIEE